MKCILIVCCLLIASVPTAAQELLTLDRAVGIALEQNRSIQGAAHDLESAHWGRLNAYTNFLPRVELSSSLTRIDPQSELMANAALDFIRAAAGALGVPPAALRDLRPFAYRDTYATGITVVQPLYNGGAEVVGVRAANALEDRSESSREDTEQDVVAKVKISYYLVLKAEELVALAHDAAERTQRYLDMTRRRAEAGMRTRTDVLRWEVQRAASEGAVITAENMLSAARLQLNEVMGVDLDARYELQKTAAADSTLAHAAIRPAPVAWAALRPDDGSPALNSAFLESHPVMKTMQANLRLADVNVQKSWVNFQPRINVAFQYGWEKNNTLRLDGIRPWALALSVSFPIFSGFGDVTNLERARADFKRTELQAESVRRGLLMQATNAQLALRAAGKRIEITRKGQQEALEVLTSISRRYETGGASNVDLIDVQTAHTAARTDYISAIYDYAIAEVQLARALGTVHR